MATPITLEERVTILETRLDTILPTLATKEDITRLDGKIDALEERLNGKIDALGNRLLIRFAALLIPLLGIAVAVMKYL